MAHLELIYLYLKIVIFHSYVSFPEGSWQMALDGTEKWMLGPKTFQSCWLVVWKTDCCAIPEFSNFTVIDRHRILRYRGSTTKQLIAVWCCCLYHFTSWSNAVHKNIQSCLLFKACINNIGVPIINLPFGDGLYFITSIYGILGMVY